mmetsp:Transcript_63133/g.137225  ORF Transcript_63133/g.137225 Transcript_63133/m.137225 type:complete len:414 (-) Transcript_63133:24-1265(-)
MWIGTPVTSSAALRAGLRARPAAASLRGLSAAHGRGSSTPSGQARELHARATLVGSWPAIGHRLFCSKPSEGKDVEVRKPTEPAEAKPKDVNESIDAVLIRAHRQELVERLGPRVERYLPTADPNAFLLPDSRLDPWERRWQKVFVALPWAAFACMLAVPMLLVRTNLPWVQQRAEEERRAAEARLAASAPIARIPEFAVVTFAQMTDVLERPFPTLVLLYDPVTFASKVFLPAFRDLAAVLHEAGIPVAVVALNLAVEPGPPDSFLWEYPRALAPHVQLVLPRAHDGEAGVVDYGGLWTASAFGDAARRLIGPSAPPAPSEELARLDLSIERLRDGIFDLLFVEDGSLQPQPAGQQRGWWRRGSGKSEADAEAAVASLREEAERSLDLSLGLDAAVTSCEEALKSLGRGVLT